MQLKLTLNFAKSRQVCKDRIALDKNMEAQVTLMEERYLVTKRQICLGSEAKIHIHFPIFTIPTPPTLFWLPTNLASMSYNTDQD